MQRLLDHLLNPVYLLVGLWQACRESRQRRGRASPAGKSALGYELSGRSLDL